MTSLLSARALCKAHSTQQLFSGLNLSIRKGDRVGLIGPNGSGKSTLLQILAGTEPANDGEIIRQKGLRIGYVPQQGVLPPVSVAEVLYQTHPKAEPHQVETALSKVGFSDYDQSAATLSGGWQKRLEIARQLVDDPDLLLLDEPTNHLDLEGILWLEKFLRREAPTYVVVSHDRAFLEATTSRIVELNPRYKEGLFAVDGSYSEFMEQRTQLIAGQDSAKAGLSSKVRREVEWLRQTPKARTTKSRSRIQKAETLKDELSDLKQRTKSKKLSISFSGTERQTRKLLSGNNLSITFGGEQLFKGVDVTLSPGTRLGLVGVNGSGKSTLLKILAGKVEPTLGTVKFAEGIRIVHFDQHREQLPLDTKLRHALSGNGQTVTYQGNEIHVSGWANRFLFPKERLDQPISLLSGGERARILIARLVLVPADILLLDEPTNDLDIETLEILEESLRDFPGAVVLITHDRLMMDEVATGIIGLGTDSDDQVFADYRQWEKHRKQLEKKRGKPNEKKVGVASSKKSRQLSYKEKQELEGMEKRILSVESEIESLPPDAYVRMGELHERLEKLYARWSELDAR
jgi:ATP-binding cassette subfamily F protein uup